MMMKKMFVTLFLSFAIIMLGTQNSEAAERYMGTYSDGTDAYLLTHSVNVTSYHPYTFTCTVRYTGNYLHYSFFPRHGSPYYRNSEGYEGYVFGGESPIAANIYNYVVNHW